MAIHVIAGRLLPTHSWQMYIIRQQYPHTLQQQPRCWGTGEDLYLTQRYVLSEPLEVVLGSPVCIPLMTGSSLSMLTHDP